MPVIRSYLMPDGSTKTEVDPEYESRYRAHMIEVAQQPKHQNDPTYNLKRKK